MYFGSIHAFLHAQLMCMTMNADNKQIKWNFVKNHIMENRIF